MSLLVCRTCGKPIAGYDQFGRMLMSFEGWQFKLEIRDRSEEI